MMKAIDVINNILREELDTIAEVKRNDVAKRIVEELHLEKFVILSLSNLRGKDKVANSFLKKELVIGIPQTGKCRDMTDDIKAYHQIRTDAVINYSVAVFAEVAERAKQEDAPIYEGDKEVDQWVRLSDVSDAINKYLN